MAAPYSNSSNKIGRTGARVLACMILMLAMGSCEQEGNHHQPHLHGISTRWEKGQKMVIYQLLPRLFSNTQTTNTPYGTLEENGVGKFNGITGKALAEIRKMGVTHVWYTGVLEHATMTAFPEAGIPADDADVVKGRAGSPYAIKDYYDVAPALAENPAKRLAEFEALMARTHEHGMQVLIDFVPNHVARNYASDAKPEGARDLGATDNTEVAFAANNNFYYLPGTSFKVPAGYDPLGGEKAPDENGKFAESPARATGNNVFSEAPEVGDWFETIKLNYGVEYRDSGLINHFDPIPDTWLKMRDILLYWAAKGVDGFRCDMAEMVPVEFWAWVIPQVKRDHPSCIFIAEIYNPNAYAAYLKEGKFDYLYDKVGVYDQVRLLMEGKDEGSTAQIRAARKQSEAFDADMLRFLENHDEQRIASEEFAGDPWAALPGMTVTALMGQGPVLVYFGQECGEPGQQAEGFQGDDGRTTIFDYWGVPAQQAWMNGGAFDGGGLSPEQKELRSFYEKLLHIARFSEAIHSGEFYPLPFQHRKIFAFLRHTEMQQVLVVANFDQADTITTQLAIPAEAWKAMDQSPIGPYLLADLLLTETQIEFDAEYSMEAPAIELVMPPNSAYVFELEGL